MGKETRGLTRVWKGILANNALFVPRNSDRPLRVRKGIKENCCLTKVLATEVIALANASGASKEAIELLSMPFSSVWGRFRLRP